MLHIGDTVEEIATKRHGRIDNTSGIFVDGQTQVTQCRVYFSDSKKPFLKFFTDEVDLRLVTCPHPDRDTSFVPARGFMGRAWR